MACAMIEVISVYKLVDFWIACIMKYQRQIFIFSLAGCRGTIL